MGNIYVLNPSVADGITQAELESQKGIADGIAELDGTGKVPSGQLPSGITGAVSYQGTWDCSTTAYPVVLTHRQTVTMSQ